MQHSVGDTPAGRDALATYRKLDERINAQLLQAVHAAETSRHSVGAEVAQDSKSGKLSGPQGLPSYLDTPAAPPAGPEPRAEAVESASGKPLPPASFRMGSKRD